MSGKVYNLKDMKVKLGATSFGGNLKIDAGSKITAISGNIQAGKIALDSLLGAKKSSAKSGGSSGGIGRALPLHERIVYLARFPSGHGSV